MEGAHAVAAATVVTVDALAKTYGRTRAVKGVGFSVAPGAIYGLVGPDGGGKSTIMKAVAGVLTFDAGRVEVFGVPLDSERAAERVKGRIGFMPQGLGLNLYPELSVDENVDFFARLRLVPPDALAERKEHLLALTRLEAFRDRLMKNLSGGMKQKLGLVCTLIHAPALVILDECTTGVDPVSRRDFWTLLETLVDERGMTALVSTAYLDEASRLHRLALVYEGRIIAEGEPDDVRALAKARVVEGRAEPQVEALRRLRATYAHVEGHGAAVRVLVPGEPGAAAPSVRRVLSGLAIGELSEREPELEDVFVWLMREARPRAPEPEPPASRAAPRAAGALAIEAVGLTRDFDRFRAVDRVSFRIHAGEIFGLLGANGAGKTTVIKMLTGILRPTAGVGQVAGVDMRRPARSIKKRIGYMSQVFSLYHDLSVVENIALSAGIYGLTRADTRERTAWILDMAGLGGHERDLAGRLPVGLRQRLALGCALVHRPHALFLDEPTSGVDPIGRRRFWDVLFALAREDGVAILLTTHDMAEAEHCDRVALMFAGRLVADATPEDLTRAVEAEVGRALDVTTDAPARALERLRAGGLAAIRHGRHVRVLTTDAAGDRARIAAALAAAGIAVHAVEPRALSMEDVFVHRVTALERAAAARA
ncbi:MAG: ABC transporter ATP-binding protein [Candidatus Rokubacteria bacterium]|nr:ABC transporter ATP-binding protein [Candidatus Rokubacteria bacterium]